MGARDRDRLSLTVVGSGTAAPEPDRVCSGYFVEAGEVRLLLDCGPGVVHHLARFGLPWPTLTHVAITHFHNDHIGDLPMLLFALQHGTMPAREAPLTVVGPPGLRTRLDRLAEALGDHVRSPRFPVEVVEMDPRASVGLGPATTLAARPTRHSETSIAFRLDAPAATIGYTGDTGYDEATADFLAGADLLVMECSLPDALAMDTHLTPATAARMAVRSDPALLLVTHVYPMLDRGALPGLLREAGWSGPTRIAHDGMRLPFPRGTGHT